MMTTLVSFYWSMLLGLLHVAFSVVRGFYRIFSVASTSDNQVQGTKTFKVKIKNIHRRTTFLRAFFSFVIINIIEKRHES